MNIVYVQIENMLGLTEAKIEPGEVTLIEGKNGAGKSAVVDAVIAAFNSKGIEGELVTKGADKGRVFIKLNDGHQIKAQFTADGKRSVNVTTPEGDTKKAPQGWLDTLFGAQVVNPISFLSMPTPEKRKVLLSALPITVTQDDLQEWFGEALPVDTGKHGLEVLSEVEKTYYDRRRNTNNEAKSVQSELDVVCKDIPADFDPDEWYDFDVSAAQGELELAGAISEQKRQLAEDAARIRRDAEKARQGAEACKTKIASIEKDIASLRNQIEAYENLIVDEREEAGMLLAYAQDLDKEADAKVAEAEAVEVPDTQAIKQKMADYSHAQRVIQQIANRDRLQHDLDEIRQKAEALDARVEMARQKPKELLAQSSLPIDGLEFTEDDIKVNGLSIDSLSDGEQLMIGVQIAKSQLGPLGLICVDGAEKLDEDNLKLLMAQADDNHHMFITRVEKGQLKITTGKEAVDARQRELFGED